MAKPTGQGKLLERTFRKSTVISSVFVVCSHHKYLKYLGRKFFHENCLSHIFSWLWPWSVNPLSPKSDQHQISPCNNNVRLSQIVTKINDMTTQSEFA